MARAFSEGAAPASQPAPEFARLHYQMVIFLDNYVNPAVSHAIQRKCAIFLPCYPVVIEGFAEMRPHVELPRSLGLSVTPIHHKRVYSINGIHV